MTNPIPVDAATEAAIDESLGLVLISLRLQAGLIEDFKNLAAIGGTRYQTLMRRVLNEHADAEKRRILRESAEALREVPSNEARP